MKSKLALVLALILVGGQVALAQAVDEMTAQAACQDDALRFCQATIPDRERTLACLIGNKAGLSGACRTVLASFFPPDPPAKRSSPQRTKRGPVNLNPTANR